VVDGPQTVPQLNSWMVNTLGYGHHSHISIHSFVRCLIIRCMERYIGMENGVQMVCNGHLLHENESYAHIINHQHVTRCLPTPTNYN
jgi:hypothetical protein